MLKNGIWDWAIRVGVPVCLVLIACSHCPERRHPSYADLAPSIRTVLFLVPEVNIFEDLADGSTVWQDAGSHAARSHVQEAVAGRLAEKHLVIRTAGPDLMAMEETRSVQTLFRAVNRSIQLHTYGPQIFPSKLRSFDYQMGSIASLLAAHGADALVLAIGHQIISPRRPKTWISVALVESQGRILWYSMQGANADLDLQSPEEAQTLVNATLQNFPGGSS